MAAKFPSVEWFEEVSRKVAENEEHFKKLGYVDALVGIKIDGNGSGVKGYILEFEDYGVKSVKEAADPEEAADFTIEGSLKAWSDMVRNIQQHGEPDLNHTLNRLTMAGVPLRVSGKDQLKTDLFFRCNQSFQAFFNEAAAVPTEYAA